MSNDVSYPLAISCLFGEDKFDVYRAPLADRSSCLFFSNNPAIAAHAERRGWTACMLDLPPASDPLVLSLYSKYVKFLAFLSEPRFQWVADRPDKGLLYFDHKFRMRRSDIRRIVARAKGVELLVRSTPKLKTSIWDEIAAAQKQERYARNMPRTRAYVEDMLAKGYSADARICATGLIYMQDPLAAATLFRPIYEACVTLQQPECQIFWALHAQDFADRIRIVEAKDPVVRWIRLKDPAAPVTAAEWIYRQSGRVAARLGL